MATISYLYWTSHYTFSSIFCHIAASFPSFLQGIGAFPRKKRESRPDSSVSCSRGINKSTIIMWIKEKRKKKTNPHSFDSFTTLYTEDFASAYSYYFSFPMSRHAVVVLWSTITGTILAMNTAKVYVHKLVFMGKVQSLPLTAPRFTLWGILDEN